MGGMKYKAHSLANVRYEDAIEDYFADKPINIINKLVDWEDAYIGLKQFISNIIAFELYKKFEDDLDITRKDRILKEFEEMIYEMLDEYEDDIAKIRKLKDEYPVLPNLSYWVD